MSKTIEFDAKYVVTAISTKEDYTQGQHIYVAHDSHSGGYPYWTTSLDMTRPKSTIEEALRDLNEATNGYMGNQATHIGIGVIRTTITLDEVDDSAIVAERKEIALNKLTEEERRLLNI